MYDERGSGLQEWQTSFCISGIVLGIAVHVSSSHWKDCEFVCSSIIYSVVALKWNFLILLEFLFLLEGFGGFVILNLYPVWVLFICWIKSCIAYSISILSLSIMFSLCQQHYLYWWYFWMQIKKVVLVQNSSSIKLLFYFQYIIISTKWSHFVLLLYQKYNNCDTSLIFFFF